MSEKTSFIIKLLLTSILVWFLTVLVFTEEINFRAFGPDQEVEVHLEDTVGTFQGEADGHNGPLLLEVVVDHEEIQTINILDHSETQGISDPAFEQIPQAIIDSNSLDVEMVSGATYTSEAIIEAVANALGDGEEE